MDASRCTITLATVLVAILLISAQPASAACRQIGNADYCHGSTQSKCCRRVDNGFFHGCIIYNNNEMCPVDRAIQVCCNPNMGHHHRRLQGADATLAPPTGAKQATVVETSEVRITSKPKKTDEVCYAACKAA